MFVKRVVGEVATVYAVCTERGRCDLEAFLSKAHRGGHTKQVDGIMAVLKRYAREPQQHLSTQVRRKIMSAKGLWELRRNDVRLLCFDGPDRSIIVSHAFWKKGQDTPTREIEKATRNREAYLRDGLKVWEG